jgi:hypothetical protein
MDAYKQDIPNSFRGHGREKYVEAMGRNGYFVIGYATAQIARAEPGQGGDTDGLRLYIDIHSGRSGRRPTAAFVGPAAQVVEMLNALLDAAKQQLREGYWKQRR